MFDVLNHYTIEASPKKDAHPLWTHLLVWIIQKYSLNFSEWAKREERKSTKDSSEYYIFADLFLLVYSHILTWHCLTLWPSIFVTPHLAWVTWHCLTLWVSISVTPHLAWVTCMHFHIVSSIDLYPYDVIYVNKHSAQCIVGLFGGDAPPIEACNHYRLNTLII